MANYKFNRVDLTQAPIVKALREHGVSVQPLNAQKEGVVDLLCAYNNVNSLLECKSEGGKLTPAQVKWHGAWNGPISICYTPEQSFLAVGLSSCASAGKGCEYHTGASVF